MQEIDVASGDVVFEWHSLDHVPLPESMQANREPAQNATKKRPLDYFHVNSVADAPGGNILISGRNTSALYLLARDGHIVWRLGGKRSDFGPPAAVKFAFQHNARLHPTEPAHAVRQRRDPEGGAVHAAARPASSTAHASARRSSSRSSIR